MNELLLTENKKIEYNGLEPYIVECKATIDDFMSNDKCREGATNTRQSSQNNSPNTIVNGNDNTFYINYNSILSDDDKLFNELMNIANAIENNTKIIQTIDEMRNSLKTPNYTNKYKEFISVISDHITLFTPLIQQLSQYL